MDIYKLIIGFIPIPLFLKWLMHMIMACFYGYRWLELCFQDKQADITKKNLEIFDRAIDVAFKLEESKLPKRKIKRLLDSLKHLS